MAIIAWYFKKYFKIDEISRNITASLKDSMAASLVIGLVAFFSLKVFAEMFDLDTFIGIFLQGLLSGLLGITAGVLVLLYLKNQEFYEFYEAFKDRIWKKNLVVTSEPEKLP